MSRASLRITDRWNSTFSTVAPRSSIWTVTASRSSPGRRLQTSLERTSGSIGSTAPGTYTLQPRRKASASSGSAGPHVGAHVGDVDPEAHEISLPLRRYGVVEVARVRWVDREGGEIAHVDPRLGGRGRARGLLGLLHRPARVREPQAAVEHQPLDHVARHVRAPDHPRHAGAALAGAEQHEIADPGAGPTPESTVTGVPRS